MPPRLNLPTAPSAFAAALLPCTVEFRRPVTLFAVGPTGAATGDSRVFNTGEVWDGWAPFDAPVTWLAVESAAGHFAGPLAPGDVQPAHVSLPGPAPDAGTAFWRAGTGYTYRGPGWLRIHRATWSKSDPRKLRAGEVLWVADAIELRSPVAIEPLGMQYDPRAEWEAGSTG